MSISNAEFLAWAKLRGIRFTAIELVIVDQLEAAYLQYWVEKVAKK